MKSLLEIGSKKASLEVIILLAGVFFFFFFFMKSEK
jgi:hypothetical protein